MRAIPFRGLLFLGLLLAVPAAVFAQNTTSGAAAHLTIGQLPVVQSLPADTTTQAWFDFQPRVGRSYCASVTHSIMSHFITGQTANDPAVTIYRNDGTTVVVSNDDIVTEPDANLQSRACFVWPTGADSMGFIKAQNVSSVAGAYDIRIVETTMFCPWFFIAGDYNAFTLIRNTTDASVSYTVNWRDATGAIVGTTSGSLAGNGNIALNARNFVNPATTSNGSVEIVHTGSEQAFMASTTTLSGTTGLGFDALFTQRQPW